MNNKTQYVTLIFDFELADSTSHSTSSVRGESSYKLDKHPFLSRKSMLVVTSNIKAPYCFKISDKSG